jgi:hypothetical protein
MMMLSTWARARGGVDEQAGGSRLGVHFHSQYIYRDAPHAQRNVACVVERVIQSNDAIIILALPPPAPPHIYAFECPVAVLAGHYVGFIVVVLQHLQYIMIRSNKNTLNEIIIIRMHRETN